MDLTSRKFVYMKYAIVFILSLFFASSAFGQIERSLFKSFDLAEIDQIKVDLDKDEVKVQTWPGDNILVESNIAFYDGTKSIFESLIENGRYSLEDTRSASVLTLSGNAKIKNPISGTTEVIERTIYIPECYELTGNVYVKTTPSE